MPTEKGVPLLEDERLLSLKASDLGEAIRRQAQERDRLVKVAQRMPATKARKKHKRINDAMVCATIAVFLAGCAQKLAAKQQGRLALFGPQAASMPELTVQDLGRDALRDGWHDAQLAIQSLAQQART